MTQSFPFATFVGLLFATLTGCGGTPAADSLRPKDPTAAEARGSQSVVVIEAQGQPLVVDWQPESRGDLEVAMREGVAVVQFDANGLMLLKDCHIDGTYGFVGVNTKEQVVRLLSAEEVRANLPAAGLGILAKLEGELGRSQALDVAIVMVGKRKTTWSSASRAELRGKCEGASHFVRGATIGAFAMRTGVRGKGRTVAEIFGAVAEAAADSEKVVQSADGLLEACRNASPEADTPPAQCGALIRLELIKIDEVAAKPGSTTPEDDRAGKNAAIAAESDAERCPKGFVFSEGKCARPDAAASHACAMDDVRDCSVQCEKGNAASCTTLGYMFSMGRGVTKNLAEATQLFEKACDSGNDYGCVNLGVSYANGLGVPIDVPKAVRQFERACAEGLGVGCRHAAGALYFGNGVRAEPQRAMRLFLTGCRAGDHMSCASVGAFYEKGVAGLSKDERKAATLYKMACDGGEALGCGNLAYMLESGLGMAKDPARAGLMYQRACAANANQCVWLGIARHTGTGLPQDSLAASQEYDKTCSAAASRGSIETQGEIVACTLMNRLYGKRYPLDMKLVEGTQKFWDEACRAGSQRDCTLLGVSFLHADPPKARPTIQAACKQGEKYACELLKLPGLR